jgi:hypothetical protein
MGNERLGPLRYRGGGAHARVKQGLVVLLAVFLAGCGGELLTGEPVEMMELVGTEPPLGSVARIGLPFAGSITVRYRFDDGARLQATCGYCRVNPSGGSRECGLQPAGQYTTDGSSVTGSGLATFRPTCSAIPTDAYAVKLGVVSFVPQRRRGDSEIGPTVGAEFPTSSAP